MIRIVLLILAALVLFIFAGPIEAQGCTSTNPGPGWVCVNGGWLPPGHPGIPVGSGGGTVTPPPTNPATFPALALTGSFAPGPVEYFTAPMVITPHSPRTWAGKVLRPSNPSYQGPLVILESMGRVELPGRVIDYPTRLVVSDLVVHGYAGQTCVEWRGVAITLDRAILVGCEEGIRFEWAVNATVTESVIFGNRIGIHFRGNGPNGLGGSITITTVRISNTRVAASYGTEAVRIGHGLGILFSDHSIIEGNHGFAFKVERSWPGAAISAVLLRDTWFEANGGAIVDPLGVIRVEGVTGSW